MGNYFYDFVVLLRSWTENLMKNCSFDEYKLLKYKMSKDELKRKPWVAFQIANLMLFYVILSIRNFIRQPIISLIISSVRNK